MFVDPVSPYFKRSAYWLAVGVWVALMLAAIIANGGTGEFTSPRAFLFVALAFLSMSGIAAITLFSRQARSALREPESDWSKARPIPHCHLPWLWCHRCTHLGNRGALVICRLTFRSSGRAPQRWPASRFVAGGAPLNS